MEEEKMLTDFFSVNGVEEVWVLGLDEKNIIQWVYQGQVKVWMVEMCPYGTIKV